MDQPDGVVGQIKEKLLKSKAKWAADGRLLTGSPDARKANRLPPGQRQVKDWPVLDLGIQPSIAPESWSLDVGGLVEAPLTWSFADLMAQPVFDDVSDIHCVTSWSRYDNRWTGVSARHLLSMVRPLPEARHVLFESYDGYTTNVTLDVFADDDVLLAHSWEGQPLTAEHGAPVRVIIPKWYFWKSAKWIKRIIFAASDAPGFWEVRGYHNEGDPWTEQRYSR